MFCTKDNYAKLVMFYSMSNCSVPIACHISHYSVIVVSCDDHGFVMCSTVLRLLKLIDRWHLLITYPDINLNMVSIKINVWSHLRLQHSGFNSWEGSICRLDGWFQDLLWWLRVAWMGCKYMCKNEWLNLNCLKCRFMPHLRGYSNPPNCMFNVLI